MKTRTLFTSSIVAVIVFGAPGMAAHAAPAFTAFESGQVRPLALSPDGSQLFVVNTPDNRLEVYSTCPEGLEHVASVPVGLEPVAVAARNNNEVWVVNHLSDSVSVVAVSNHSAHVTRTLLVGDEPRDIVFAGPGKSRAFITAAHRGQNAPFDPQLTTPGVGRADVWVFNAGNQGNTLGGTPLTIVNLFSDTPRALAVSPDGKKVYAAAFASGNRTAIVALGQVPDGGEADGGIPLPNVSHAGIPEPDMSLIVKFDGQHWVDETGKWWDDNIKFNLPDRDVFVINAWAPTPALVNGPGGSFSGVGTVLFNMIANPVSGKVYVSNTEARNEVRFEGLGEFAETTVRGHAVDNRITVLDAQGSHPRDLNPHIDRDAPFDPVPNDTGALSVAQPLGMAISPDGDTLYVAALGNDKVAIYDTDELEDDSFFPDAGDQIAVSGGGPTGVVLDAARDRLYVMTRFDNGISIIDTDAREETDHLTMHNPEPASLVAGRRFLYDAALTSSNGDSVVRELSRVRRQGRARVGPRRPGRRRRIAEPPNVIRAAFFGIGQTSLHPMKGPMTTQSLRGMANHGPMHWRGDRNGEGQGANVQPDGGAFSEQAAFKAFNPAFVGLLGRNGPLTPAQLQAFTDFQLQVTYPPNPIRALDGSFTARQQAGRDFFVNNLSFALGELFTCEGCHTLDPQGNAQHGVDFPGFFGTSGLVVPGEFSQTFKIPHLRNAYTKVGTFGFGDNDFFFNQPGLPHYDASHQGDQIRAFGFTHDGSKDTPMRFFNAFVATPDTPNGFTTFDMQKQVAEFIYAFDSNLKPIVGQQITLTASNSATAGPRIDLLQQRADLGECELIVKASFFGVELGAYFNGRLGKLHQSSVAGAPNVSRQRTLRTQLDPAVGQAGRPTPACRRARASASASIVTATATATATSCSACSDPADPNRHALTHSRPLKHPGAPGPQSPGAHLHAHAPTTAPRLTAPAAAPMLRECVSPPPCCSSSSPPAPRTAATTQRPAPAPSPRSPRPARPSRAARPTRATRPARPARPTRPTRPPRARARPPTRTPRPASPPPRAPAPTRAAPPPAATVTTGSDPPATTPDRHHHGRAGGPEPQRRPVDGRRAARSPPAAQRDDPARRRDLRPRHLRPRARWPRR
jgi:DNA-binding beta-propeller fold protein YncE